jgi:hypothetical protein
VLRLLTSPPIIILLIALAEIDESLLEIIELIVDDPLDTVPLLNVSTFWPDNLNVTTRSITWLLLVLYSVVMLVLPIRNFYY